MIGEHEHVVAALAQGREGELEHGEPMIEVGAETPLSDRGVQVFVGRAEDGDVDGFAPRTAQPAHGALLDDLEELGLHRLGKQPDLVEEDGAAMSEAGRVRAWPAARR